MLYRGKFSRPWVAEPSLQTKNKINEVWNEYSLSSEPAQITSDPPGPPGVKGPHMIVEGYVKGHTQGSERAYAGKGAHESEWPTEVNRWTLSIWQRSNFFARFAHKLIPCSPTFKMMAPSLNVRQTVVLLNPVSNSMLLELKRGWRKRSGQG